MKNATLYKCTSRTEATDRANLWYIASPSASRMQRDAESRQITISSRAGKPLAVFAY